MHELLLPSNNIPPRVLIKSPMFPVFLSRFSLVGKYRSSVFREPMRTHKTLHFLPWGEVFCVTKDEDGGNHIVQQNRPRSARDRKPCTDELILIGKPVYSSAHLQAELLTHSDLSIAL